MSDKKLSEEFDLDTWKTPEPKAGFAERVTAQAFGEPKGADAPDASEDRRVSLLRRRRTAVGAAAATLAIAAGVMLWIRPSEHGDVTVAAREEIKVGARAIAVAEKGTQLRWDGPLVTQESGDVFYRVEKGGQFKVHTPAGDVEVKGTCFRVRIKNGATSSTEDSMDKKQMQTLGIGAALGAIALVTVYEGKVLVSRGNSKVDLNAGEATLTSAQGVTGPSSPESAEAALQRGASSDTESAVMKANRSLVDTVRDYKHQLEENEREKKALIAKLNEAEEKQAATTSGPKKSEFELSRDDWSEMAKTGSIAYRIPCSSPKLLTAEKLNRLGLADGDAEKILAAQKKTNAALDARLMPICTQYLTKELCSRLGSDAIHTIMQLAQSDGEKGGEKVTEAMKETGRIRAGQRPAPTSGEKLDPVTSSFLALTDAQTQFESELAQDFGPDEAHRIAFSDELCANKSRFGR